MQIKQLIGEYLPPPLRQWLWERKVAVGNRRMRDLGTHLSAQIHEAVQQDMAIWNGLNTKVEWESFRDVRCDALRRSLKLNVGTSAQFRPLVTSTLQRNGYVIDNVVFHGHMDLPVTANIYRPLSVIQNTPAIVLCHSHHDSKTEEELQCMGMTWAQQGCTVFIMDLLGHGERRQHPFEFPQDYSGAFRVDRQDYYFRYVLNMQLQLMGESLMGWMVQDVQRGIDLLLADSHIDRKRIIVMGSVAGGGDLAAVVGALDPRVSAVVAFNFGQLTMGDWESTRNLPNTAQLRFWPWVILASLAPRRLVYGREFSWNRGDVAWDYLQTIYGLYEKPEALRSVHGSGCVSGNGSLDSHCMNIGPLHRAQLYPILYEWFDIPIPEHEVTEYVPKDQLHCMTEEARKIYVPRTVHVVAQELCAQYLSIGRDVRTSQNPHELAMKLQHDLVHVLGPMGPCTSYRVQSVHQRIGRSEYVKLAVEENIQVRVQILWPSDVATIKPLVVIGLAQEGNRRLKRERQLLIRQLLSQGVVVCLTELRGIGDGRQGEVSRGRISPSASVAATSLMLGECVLTSRVRDLRTVLAYLRHRDDMDTNRIGLWGDSLAAPNHPHTSLAVPLDADPYPERGEPLGGVVSLLTALFEPQIQAVYVYGGLASYASLLEGPFVYQPVDAMIPDLVTVTDLPDITAALAPRPLRMEGCVDGQNQLLTVRQIEEVYRQTRISYSQTDSPEQCSISVERTSSHEISRWFMSSFSM
ncbi:acetylxylan esterase [Nitrospira sp. M1]